MNKGRVKGDFWGFDLYEWMVIGPFTFTYVAAPSYMVLNIYLCIQPLMPTNFSPDILYRP